MDPCKGRSRPLQGASPQCMEPRRGRSPGMCPELYAPLPYNSMPPSNSPRATSEMTWHVLQSLSALPPTNVTTKQPKSYFHNDALKCSRPKLYAHRITSSTQQWTLWNGFKSSSKQMQARKQNIIWFRDTFDKFVKHQTVFLFVSELCGNLSIFKLWFVIGVFAQKWEPGQ